jgi:DNA-binding NarL/FixJ family response regulator
MKKAAFRVLLVEDIPAIAFRFKQILSDWPRVTEVTVCHSLEAAISEINNKPIDLFVVDLKLPDGSGVEAIRFLGEKQPQSVSVVISALSQRQIVVEALKAGAVGYLLKDDDTVDILAACELALTGRSMMSGAIARMMIELVRSEQHVIKKQSPLTEREEEVLRGIAHGYTYREVADMLGLSEHTVPVHIRNIYRKLKVTNRSQATYEARLIGVLSD